MQLSCVIITLQIFWAKPGNPREGGRVERSNERGGRSREGEARAKPGNQLVINKVKSTLLKLGEEEIPCTNTFKYLGSIFAAEHRCQHYCFRA